MTADAARERSRRDAGGLLSRVQWLGWMSRGRRRVRPSVVLTGIMGTGKTTVGRIIAERIGYTFVDTDEIIESRFGPISEIFETQGEPAFRDMERDVSEELSAKDRYVISTGGGLMLGSGCRHSLEPHADVVCLTAEPETILERVTAQSDVKRPLLGKNPLRTLRVALQIRAPIYGRYPSVDTTERSPEEVAEAVIELLGYNG